MQTDRLFLDPFRREVFATHPKELKKYNGFLYSMNSSMCFIAFQALQHGFLGLHSLTYFIWSAMTYAKELTAACGTWIANHSWATSERHSTKYSSYKWLS